MRFTVAVVAFAAANVISLFVRSDDLWTPDTPDAMTRFGFPVLAYQDGGPVALCFFSRRALMADVAIAMAGSAVVATWYGSVRDELRRTLGYDIRAS